MDMNHVGMGWLLGGTFGGLILGMLTNFWTRLKGIFWRVIRRFITGIEIKESHMANAVLAYFLENYKRSSYHDATYSACHDHLRIGKYGLISYEYLGGKDLLFWNGWLPIMFVIETPASTTTPSTGFGQAAATQPKTILYFFRGTFDAEIIIKEATNKRNELAWDTSEKNKVKRFFIKTIPNHKDKNQETKYSVGTALSWYQEPVHRLITHAPAELGRSALNGRKALDLLVFPQRVKNLISEIVVWRRNRHWYLERGIPWKRGWLLYGPPGTGKTALVRAFAEDLDLPLFSYSLGEMMNMELQKSWEEMQAHTPCIALFEDIDNVFHGRENVFRGGSSGVDLIAKALSGGNNKKEPANGAKESDDKPETHNTASRLSFDCLLNCLDGVDKADGVFVVITTNHIDKIDEAIGRPRQMPDGSIEFISTRPGRIDKAIELTHMIQDDKYELAERILNDRPEGLKRIKEFIKEHPSLMETPAQFQERCAQMALSYFWKEQCGSQIGHDTFETLCKRAITVPVNETNQ